MNIKFDPNNNVIKLCVIGMSLEDSGNAEEAKKTFQQAWDEATDDYENLLRRIILPIDKRISRIK
ncbi:hypothetical protein [Lacrimispora xylanisolvens]|uniref:hypothetical protein n=1 Tax=Lacrimispora xylanisolvens TaxID=384636 RepID=UPI0024029B0E